MTNTRPIAEVPVEAKRVGLKTMFLNRQLYVAPDKNINETLCILLSLINIMGHYMSLG